MARKPTRLWDPARRLFIRAQEGARTFTKSRKEYANLDDVRARLQHYLRAMYGDEVAIEALPRPKKLSWAKVVLERASLAKMLRTSESSGNAIRLPPTLGPAYAGVSPLEQYRVLAVQHAERLARASARHAKDVTSDLEQDLYMLAELAAIDAHIAETQPGLQKALDAAREQSLSERGRPRFRSSIEQRVEQLIRETLSTATDASGASTPANVPLGRNAESNATWARRTAVDLEVKFGKKAAQEYRRAAEITFWNTTITSRLGEEMQQALETEKRETTQQQSKDEPDFQPRSHMPGAGQAGSSQNEHGKETNEPAGEGAGSKVSSDDGQNQDSESDGKSDAEADADKDAESNSTDDSTAGNKSASDSKGGATDPNAKDVSGTSGDATKAGVQHSDIPVGDEMIAEGVSFRYPEWNHEKQDFNDVGTVVRIVPPELGPSDWARSTLAQHAREVHRARQQFERLRSHRARLRRQLQGDELDLEACVEAMVDRRMRTAPTDRLYSTVRPGRRELAITLLIDISGSTSDIVEGDRRVIDIERISAVIATAAFDALGDDYSILAFSSASASNVRMHTVKDFGERTSTEVLQRISALEPHGTTRLGAAVRHATAMLRNHPAPHRLLLIISDGKPFDYDWYFIDYAIQDSRHAVMSARLQGVHPFCITVDVENEDTYLPEIFGSAGYRIVSDPSQLSQALLQAVQRMIGAG